MTDLTPEPVTTSVAHIAGTHVTVRGRHIRQRCGWCGALLVEHDLGDRPHGSGLLAGPDGRPLAPADAPVLFTPGVMVRVTTTGEDRTVGVVNVRDLPDDFCEHLP